MFALSNTLPHTNAHTRTQMVSFSIEALATQHDQTGIPEQNHNPSLSPQSSLGTFLNRFIWFFFFFLLPDQKEKKKDRGKKNFKRAEYPVGCKQLSHASGYSSAVIIQSHDGPRRYIPKTAFFWSKREQQHREIPCTADATRRQLRIPRLLGHIYTQRLSCPPV